jgi:hypothetical protein
MSELRAPALRGDVALAEGATARLAGLRGGFFDDFFDDFLRVEELCFFRVVCGIESIGATASAASSTTTRALSLR